MYASHVFLLVRHAQTPTPARVASTVTYSTDSIHETSAYKDPPVQIAIILTYSKMCVSSFAQMSTTYKVPPELAQNSASTST